MKGINVLEVDVLNADPFKPPSQRRTAKSRMSCRVELEGEVCRDPGLGGDDASGKAADAGQRKQAKAASEPNEVMSVWRYDRVNREARLSFARRFA